MRRSVDPGARRAPRPFADAIPRTIGRIELLTVCTGNICRSPMAEVLLRARLAELGVDASVASAGTLAWGGPATANSCIVVDELGVNLRGHLSQQLTADLVGPADLVLGMTRDHVWRATRLDAGATDRSFLIGELVRLGRRVGPRAEGEPVRDWAARAAAERVDGRPIGQVGDEVADPVGEPIHVYRATAARLDHDVRAIAELLVPTP